MIRRAIGRFARACIVLAAVACAPTVGAARGTDPGADRSPDRARSESPGPAGDRRSARDPGDFVPRYEPPLSDTYVLYHDELKRERFLDAVADELNRLVQVPGNVTLRLAECGHSTTGWSRESRTVTVCYEFLDAVIAIAGEGTGASDDETASTPAGEAAARRAERWFGGAVTFALFAEVGRALAELYSLPDPPAALAAGDDFAALALGALERDGDDGGAAAIEFYGYALRDPASGFEYLETHALDPARLERIACLLYGSAPRSLPRAVDAGVLPRARSAGCESEADAAHRSWERLLGTRLR